MPQIVVKRSSVPGKVPTTTDLSLGEIAVNTYDGKMFIKKNVSGTESIVDITASAGGGATNLTYSANGSTVTVLSDTGTDAVVLAANSTIAGVLTAEAQTIAGAKTFTAATTTFGSGVKFNGPTGAMTAGHTGVYGYLLNTTGGTDISGSGINLIAGDTLTTFATFSAAGGAQLRFNDIVRFQTTGSGVTVTGNVAVTSTITSGTWNGSVISSTYGGTGVNNGGRTLTINTGNLTIASQAAGSTISLGGNITTANSFTTSGNFALTLTTTAATSVTLPTSGTLISSADTGTVTSAMIANSTIVDADISGTAAIAVTKLAASTISGVTLGNNLNALTLGSYLTGTSYNGSTAVTAAVDATTDASAGKIVARDSTGAISANTVNVTRADGNAAMLNFNTASGQRSYLLANNSAWSVVVVAGANSSSYPNFSVRGDNNGLIYNAGKGGGDQLVWHAGNDGAGSGLDADLLDGLNSSSASTASTIVARDASSNFSANTVTIKSISANGSIGSSTQVLTSNGTGIYWATPSAGSSNAAVSDTAPSSPVNGSMWYDSSDGSFNVYYADGTSSQWVNVVNNQNDPVFRVKTSNYTASNRDQIIADTSGGSFTITLPASPIAGTAVTLYDNASWGTNNLTIARNGSTIEGVADDFVLDVSSIKVEFIYNGSTWQVYSSVAQGGPASPSVTSAEFAAIAIALG